MAEVLMLIPPCIALMAPVMSLASNISLVLALTVFLSIPLAILCLQTWNMRNDDEAEAEDEDDYETDAVIEDATNIVHAAFAAMARSSGAVSISFRAENGMTQYQHSTPCAPSHGDQDGYIYGIRSGEVHSGYQYSSATYGTKLECWPEPWGKHYTISKPSSRKGYAGFQKLGGFRISTRNLEDADLIAHMV